MSTVTLITMVLTMGIVWGGFVAVLVTALRKERNKITQ
ncbi:MAG: methionine/alanine import family NSS transporter small subunit [Ignavibacteriales bacterium]|nr:methionine/alanine import family NSS transporter small subunit [Ignavibacteriales bacterium]